VHVVLQRLQFFFLKIIKNFLLQNVAYYIDVFYASILNNILWMGHYIMILDRCYSINILRLRTEYSQYPCSELLYSVSSI